MNRGGEKGEKPLMGSAEQMVFCQVRFDVFHILGLSGYIYRKRLREHTSNTSDSRFPVVVASFIADTKSIRATF